MSTKGKVGPNFRNTWKLCVSEDGGGTVFTDQQTGDCKEGTKRCGGEGGGPYVNTGVLDEQKLEARQAEV